MRTSCAGRSIRERNCCCFAVRIIRLARSSDVRNLLAIAEICERHDLLICSDEIHCDLILDPAPSCPFRIAGQGDSRPHGDAHVSVQNLQPVRAELRLRGDPNPELRKRFQVGRPGTWCRIRMCSGYVACQAAYEEGEAWRVALLDYLRGNRDLLASFFAERLPRLKMSRVEATYLAWIDTRCLGEEERGRLF